MMCLKRTGLCLIALVCALHAAAGTLEPMHRFRVVGIGKGWLDADIAFAPNGQLYVVFGKAKKRDPVLSTYTVQVYDGWTGDRLRQAEIELPEKERPRSISHWELSSDGRLALLADRQNSEYRGPAPRNTRVGVLDIESMTVLSTAIILDDELDGQCSVSGFSRSAETVQMACIEYGERYDRSFRGMVDRPVRVRSIEFDPLDLTRTIRTRAAETADPDPYWTHVDNWRNIWFVNRQGRFQLALPGDGRSDLLETEISTLNFGSALGAFLKVLPGAVLAFTAPIAYSDVFRYEAPIDAGPVATHREDTCGIEFAEVSNNGRVAAAVCRGIPYDGFFGGQIYTAAHVVVLDTKTLQPLATIPLSKWGAVVNGLSVAHQDGRTLVAMLTWKTIMPFVFTRRVAIYEFEGP